ncbi:MAG: hypothetical protein PUI89_00045 [Bacteroidales bacterium]|uniref:hypothetical protein n=1 Tax=Porphyromonas sp. TaxID=1924944 RepID=UPI002A807883|nr:hypothetical protein [Porphyromonas sp.]MDD6927670.1 hypothetical protein [Bacteroidales bacterium]MDY4245663.1 hypothetical protein [Porphyromonas sp.]
MGRQPQDVSLIEASVRELHMSDKRGIDEITLYNNVSAMDWLLAVSYRSYQSDRISNL